MFKRFLITLALGVASTGFAASSLPTDSKYNSVVTLKTGNSADDLSMVLRALGASVGLTVVADSIPVKSINYDISGKPFRDVWELLIELNGLDYEFKSNNIVVVGPPSVIASIRKPAAAPASVTAASPVLERRFYNLNGSPAELVAFLSKEVPKAVINAVGTSKIIAVTGTGSEQGEIATLLSRVDPAPVNEIPKPVVAQAPVPSERRVFTVNGAVADVVAFLKGEYPKANINAIGSSKTVAVTASSDELDEITDLLAQVDPIPEPAPVVEVPAPVEVAVPVVAPIATERRVFTVNGAVADVVAFLKGEYPKAVVNAIGSSKTVAVTASSDELDEITDLLAQVDPVLVVEAPPAPTPVVTERQLYSANGNPDDVQAFILKEFPQVSVSGVKGSKTLVINATAAQQKDINSLLGKVDPVPPPPAVVELPPLPEIVPTSRELYTINGSVSEIVAFLAKELPKASLNPVGGGSKVVALTGTDAEQKQAKALLVTIDPQVAVAPVATPQLLERQTYQTNANAVDIAALVNTEFPGVVTSTLGKTDSKILVVRAPSSVQVQVKSFLEQVDPVAVIQRPDITQRTFQLVNAKAVDIKTVLENTLKTATTPTVNPSDVTPTSAQVAQQFQNGASQSATGGNAVIGAAINAANAQNAANAANTASTPTVAAPANAVSIIADARTNTLIARGTQLQINQIAELIPTLDRRLPSINVQVRIQEVSETATNTLGLDWSAGLGNFTTKILGGSLTGIFDATKSLAGFNIGATLTALEKQGVSKRVDDSNVTLDGGQPEAILKSGGELSINIVGNGTQKIEKTLPYGVQISLTNARVDPDGTIHVDVASKVTDFITPPTEVALINTTNREARTSITLKSGQTALLGGLLTNKDKTNSTGVPFLSSIPLIGNLFKTETRESERTQILLVVSANILE